MTDIIKSEDAPAGTSTFVNIGNTCYMNAVLQSLMATDNLMAYLIDDKYIDDLKNDIKNDYMSLKKSLICSLGHIINRYWYTRCSIKPEKFKHLVGMKKHSFIGFSQNDSHEVLQCILEHIHEEIIKKVNVIFKKENDIQYKNFISNIEKLSNDEKISYFNKDLDNYILYNFILFYNKMLLKNYSQITKIFTGITVNIITCHQCNKKAINFESFNTLSLAINNSVTLTDCLDNYFKKSELNDDNKYQCDTCNMKTNATSQFYLWDFPSKLIIQLSRFSYKMAKKTDTITFPLDNLNVAQYHPYKISPKIYCLYAIIVHHGSFGGGHYVAYTKNLIDKSWYFYNDNIAFKVIDITKELDFNNSYILFYERTVD